MSSHHLKTTSQSQMCFGDVQVGKIKNQTTLNSLQSKNSAFDAYPPSYDDFHEEKGLDLSKRFKPDRYALPYNFLPRIRQKKFYFYLSFVSLILR